MPDNIMSLEILNLISHDYAAISEDRQAITDSAYFVDTMRHIENSTALFLKLTDNLK